MAGQDAMMDLQGKRILLTGAGSGIGRATALLRGRRGARLVLFGRRAEPLEALRAELGGGVMIAGDVADGAARTRAITAAVMAFGGLDILINNAGNVRAGRLELTPEAALRFMIEVDLLAPILLTREALPCLRQSGKGAVVNATSGAALVGMPFYATYGAAKAGPDLGWTREPPEAVTEALVAGLEAGALEVVRGGEVRAAMVALNREHPDQVDERFRGMKDRLEAAVSGHDAP